MMTMMRIKLLSLMTTLLMWNAGVVYAQQMEKRELNLYAPGGFALQHPRIGTSAPDLEMLDLEGNPVRLSGYAGKTVVLIKAGYT